MPEISGLGHVGLFCNDLPKMRDFYARVLGLTISDENLERGICFLSAVPDAEHHDRRRKSDQVRLPVDGGERDLRQYVPRPRWNDPAQEPRLR